MIVLKNDLLPIFKNSPLKISYEKQKEITEMMSEIAREYNIAILICSQKEDKECQPDIPIVYQKVR